MTTETNYLEHKFFYRLVKILYSLSLALLVFATIYYMASLAHQTMTQDNKNSYVVCLNGKKYPLEAVGIEMYFYGHSVGEKEQRIADKFCLTQSGPINLLSTNQINVAFKMDLYSARYDFIAIFFISLLFYGALNITREALIYLAFAKKFTWGWLLKFMPFITKRGTQC